MGGAALQRRDLAQPLPVMTKADRHRRQPHQRAIAGAARIGRAGDRLAIARKAIKRGAHRVADIEAGAAIDDIVAMIAPAHKALHQVSGIERAVAGDQAVGQTQRHAGVVGPFAGLKAVPAAADHVLQRRISVARQKLQRHAERIADREPEQRAISAIAPRLGRGPPLGHCAMCQHIFLLVRRFDRTRPRLAHLLHGADRLCAKFNEQARGDGAGAAKPAAAMHHHVETAAQHSAQALAGVVPGVFKRLIRRRDIDNRQVVPQHLPLPDRVAEPFDPQHGQLARLDQRHHRGRAPCADRVKIKIKIAAPGAGRGVRIVFAGTEGDADPAMTGADQQLGNLKRMRGRGSHGSLFMISVQQRGLRDHRAVRPKWRSRFLSLRPRLQY